MISMAYEVPSIKSGRAAPCHAQFSIIILFNDYGIICHIMIFQLQEEGNVNANSIYIVRTSRSREVNNFKYIGLTF